MSGIAMARAKKEWQPETATRGVRFATLRNDPPTLMIAVDNWLKANASMTDFRVSTKDGLILLQMRHEDFIPMLLDLDIRFDDERLTIV
jgi:hypothetical protein